MDENPKINAIMINASLQRRRNEKIVLMPRLYCIVCKGLLCWVRVTAALTVWGFSDGQPYMRAQMGSTTFNMQLPATQDYIIDVVPQAGQEVSFTLRVEITDQRQAVIKSDNIYPILVSGDEA